MSRPRLPRVVIGLIVVLQGLLSAQQQTTPRELAIRYTRDSEEYATIARQIYRLATDSITRLAPGFTRGSWVVVLDVDETALDNSAYQLERAAYSLPFDSASWSAWVRRRESAAVPGTADFTRAVRQLGGHVAWITNRSAADANATRDNLRSAGLWSDDDRLCAQNEPQHTKRARRAEVIAGSGACAWAGVPMTVVALVGDQMSDFPESDEPIRDAGNDGAFGRTFFLLPNAMYGAWTTRVTRTPR